MAVKIRLTRMGDKKAPFYRVVATDGRCARDGKVIENLGTYNPLVSPAKLELNKERVSYWLSCGATPTETARELLIKEGLVKATVYRAPLPKKMPPAKKEAPAEKTADETTTAEKTADETTTAE